MRWLTVAHRIGRSQIVCNKSFNPASIFVPHDTVGHPGTVPHTHHPFVELYVSAPQVYQCGTPVPPHKDNAVTLELADDNSPGMVGIGACRRSGSPTIGRPSRYGSSCRRGLDQRPSIAPEPKAAGCVTAKSSDLTAAGLDRRRSHFGRCKCRCSPRSVANSNSSLFHFLIASRIFITPTLSFTGSKSRRMSLCLGDTTAEQLFVLGV